MTRHLSFGLGRNDRTAAIVDGSVTLAECEMTIDSSPHEELFRLALDEQHHDVTELSLANYIMRRSANACGYVALPIFTSRMFRHAAIYVRDDRGISAPGDLAGKSLGLREFSNTATVTAKGALSDEYGLTQDTIAWRFGRVNLGEPSPIVRKIPDGVRAQPIATDETLSDLLALGELDGIIAYDPPACFVERQPHIRRLFPDYAAAERAYFARTRVFPIMHLIVIRESLAGDAALCKQLCNAFEAAKQRAFEDLHNPAALPIMLPWLEQAIAQAQSVLGNDYWPYGIEANRTSLSATTRWLWEQKLIDARIEPTSLFAPSILNWQPQHATPANISP